MLAFESAAVYFRATEVETSMSEKTKRAKAFVQKPIHESVTWRPSPHFADRHGAQVELIVMHYDGAMDDNGGVNWMCDSRSGVSAHFDILRTGKIVQMVDLRLAAQHAGTAEAWLPGSSDDSPGQTTSMVNSKSIGIELANAGKLDRGSDGRFWKRFGARRLQYKGPAPVWGISRFDGGSEVPGWWEPFTREQVNACIALLAFLRANGHEKAVSNLQGHDEVAMPMGRKIDPGPLFPWERFSRNAPRRVLPVHGQNPDGSSRVRSDQPL